MFRKLTLALFISVLSVTVFAEGYSNWAVPTQLEYVNNGILISGEFGDTNNCGKSNYIFIPNDTEDGKAFQAILSMVYIGFTAKKEMRFYSNSCAEVNFHWSGNVISQTNTWKSVYIR